VNTRVPVDALPPEGVVREPVDGVPRELLGQEPPEAGQLHDLRQCGGVAEGVRQPDLRAVDAELLEEPLLAVQELPHHRLAADHVRVGLHPHATDRDQPAGPHVLGCALEQHAMVLLEPGPLLGARHRVHQLVTRVDQVDRVGDRARDLADSLADRPQPGRVDVGVANRADPVCAGVRRPGEYAGQLGACARRGGDDVLRIEPVERRLQRVEDLPAAGILLGQRTHQTVEHIDVGGELDDFVVAPADVGLVHAVERAVSGGQPVAVRDWPEPRTSLQGWVRRRFDVHVDAFAGCDRDPAVAGVQALDVAAVGTVDQTLGLHARAGGGPAEVDQQLGRREVVGDLAGHVEPAGPPRRTPGVAHCAGDVGCRAGLRERHRLAHPAVGRRRHVPDLEIQLGHRRVERGADPLLHRPGDPGLDLASPIVHVRHASGAKPDPQG